MIKLDAVINDKTLLSSIQKGVDTFNRSRAGKSKLNLKINEKGFRQPLGRITGDLDKFESALAASNARVIAFGASTAVIGGVSKAFKSLLATTDKVQKQFTDINRILGVSNRQFEEFSGRLFDIGKKTATTFDDASKAALEFARQGLNLNETLKRTSDALTLVRLTGVNADKAVSALTATVNAFQHSSLTTTEALNKFIAVETKYAVSARDLMEGLGRVGSAAVDAKVSFDELNAMIAAVQQQTGRGGAVIGNAMKTIFTRLQRQDTLEALESYNIAVRDIDGNTRPAMNILQDFAKTYKTLSDANRAYLREQVAGVFQANILSAIVKDLNSNMQVYGRSLHTSTSATNEAEMANAKLNVTLNAMISQTGTELVRLQENIGKVTLEPIAKALLGPFKSIIGDINHILDGEGLGSDLANGFLKGLRNILAGPGLVAAVAIIGTTIFKTLSYITKALPTLVGITNETTKRAKLEASISAMLATDAGLVKQIAAAEGNAAVQAGILLGAAEKAKTAFAAQATSTAAIAANLAAAGMTTNKMGAIVPAGRGRGAFGRGASGFIPGVAGEMHDIRRGTGGVSPSARPVHIPNFAFGGGQYGSMVANTGEHIVPNFRGGGSAIFNPAMVRANGGLPQGAKRITAAQGYVPNFAPLAYTAGMNIVKSGNLAGWNTHRDTLRAAGQHSWADKLEASRAKVGGKRAAATTKAKTKDLFSLTGGQLGIGAVVGMAKRKPPYNTSTGFAQILASKSKTKVADPDLLAYMQAHKHKKAQITGVPVGALNRLGKSPNADQQLENKFSGRLNKFMMPALSKYTADIFKDLLKDDGRGFIKSLKKKTNQRVFSTSTEGGIFEAGLQFASRKASNFSGDDMARFDFEESGNINPVLKDAFFPGSAVRRADAKRSDSAENIQSLIAKSFGTSTTAIRWKEAMSGSIAKWKAAKSKRGGTPTAAGGFVPNFSGLGAAISREKASGVPSSSIRINSDPRFTSAQNPAGLAVTNTYDEPRGLRDVPNFADLRSTASTSAGVMRGLTGNVGRIAGPFPDRAAMARVNKASMALAQALADGTMSQKQVTRTLGKLGSRIGMSDTGLYQLNTAITQAGTQLKTLATASKAAAAKTGMFAPGGFMGSGGRFAKMTGAGSGMGGMALMMGAPMIGGFAEQAIGGRAGATVGGAMTGAVTTGFMGSMVGGALAGGATGSIAPGVGTIIGAVVGGIGGAFVAFSEATETATEGLVAFNGKMEANIKGANAFMAAQKAMVSAEGAVEFDDAMTAATDALYAIDDPALRKAIQNTAGDFEALSAEIKKYKAEQAEEMLIRKSLSKAEGVMAADLFDEQKNLRKGTLTGSDAPEAERKTAMRQLAREVLTPLASAIGGRGRLEGLSQEQIKERATTLQKAFGVATQNLRGMGTKGPQTAGGMKEDMMAAMMEAQIPTEQAQAVGDFFEKLGGWGTGAKRVFRAAGSEQGIAELFSTMLAFAVEEEGKNFEKFVKGSQDKRENLANFTKAMNEVFDAMDTAMLVRAAAGRKMATNLARRGQRANARQSLLSGKLDPFTLAKERAQIGLDDIGGRRQMVSGEVIAAQGKQLTTLIEKIAKGSTDILKKTLVEDVQKPFNQGNFRGAMEALRAQTTATGAGGKGLRLDTKVVKDITTFNRNLVEELNKRADLLNKEEQLLLDKFKEDAVRDELLIAERDINLQKVKYLKELNLSFSREQAASSARTTGIDQRLRDPRETRFMRSDAAFMFRTGLERQKLGEQEDLKDSGLELDIKTRNAELVATNAAAKATSTLVLTNLEMIKLQDANALAQQNLISALNDNTVALGGTPSGVSVPSSSAPASGGKKADLEVTLSRTSATVSQNKKATASLTPHVSREVDFAKDAAEMRKLNSEIDNRVKLNEELTAEKKEQRAIERGSIFGDFDSNRSFDRGLQKSETKFTEGIKTGLGAVWTDSEGIFNKLGTDLPMQFRNNMVGAMEAAMDKTSSLGDALDGVALAFLSTMRQAFLQSAVSNMMNTGSALFGLDPKQRGGAIRAQNGMFVGGSGSGDKHPALLESGEYVLNRNAVGALGGPAALDSINFGMAPRFQKGGGHLMALSEKLPSSRMSGLFLQQGNPEYNEIADKAQERMQKAQEKHAKKEQRKAMILSTIISGVMAAGMGAASKGISKWKSTKVPGSNWWGGIPEDTMAIGNQTGGFIRRQSGGSIGGGVARRYGLFQGGGSVPVSSGVPSLGGSTNTNNISINIGLGGDNESAGSGASQTATGNTGAPSQATTADAKALSQKIKSQVLKILIEEQRVGGTLSPTARRA